MICMKEYEFVPLTMRRKLLSGMTEGHREIIREWAGKGWSYGGFLPTEQLGDGFISEVELIFYREVPENG